MAAETPPGFTSYQDKHYIEWLYEQPGVKEDLTASAIAESVEKAEEDLEDAQIGLETKQDYMKRQEEMVKKGYLHEAVLLERKAVVATAELELALAKLRLINTKIAKLQEKPERSTNFSQKTEGESSFFKGVKVKAGRHLKTHRSKHRNGSSRLRRHGASHMSRRKVKA